MDHEEADWSECSLSDQALLGLRLGYVRMNAGQLTATAYMHRIARRSAGRTVGPAPTLDADSLPVQVLSPLALQGDHCAACGGCAREHGGRPQVDGVALRARVASAVLLLSCVPFALCDMS